MRTRKLTVEQESRLREFFKLTEEFEKSFGKRKKIKSRNLERNLTIMISLSFLLSCGIVVNIYLSYGNIGELLWAAIFFIMISVLALIAMEIFILLKSDNIKKIYEGLVIARMKFSHREAEFEKMKKATDDLLSTIPISSLIVISVIFLSSLLFVFLKNPPNIVSYVVGLIVFLSFIYGMFRSIRTVVNFRRTVDSFISSFQGDTYVKEAEHKVN